LPVDIGGRFKPDIGEFPLASAGALVIDLFQFKSAERLRHIDLGLPIDSPEAGEQMARGRFLGPAVAENRRFRLIVRVGRLICQLLSFGIDDVAIGGRQLLGLTRRRIGRS
jgi:hypothetical protein